MISTEIGDTIHVFGKVLPLITFQVRWKRNVLVPRFKALMMGVFSCNIRNGLRLLKELVIQGYQAAKVDLIASASPVYSTQR